MDRSNFGSETGFNAAQAQEHARLFVANLKPGVRARAVQENVGETVQVHFVNGDQSVDVTILSDGSYTWTTTMLLPAPAPKPPPAEPTLTAKAGGKGTVEKGATSALIDAIRELVTELDLKDVPPPPPLKPTPVPAKPVEPKTIPAPTPVPHRKK